MTALLSLAACSTPPPVASEQETGETQPATKDSAAEGPQAGIHEAQAPTTLPADSAVNAGSHASLFVDSILGTQGSLDDLQRRQEVLDQLEAKLATAPTSAPLMVAVAVTLCDNADLVDGDGELLARTLRAQELLESGLSKDPSLTIAHRTLAAIYGLTDPARAATSWEQVLAAEPEDLAVLTLLGEEYIKASRFDEARALARRSLEIARQSGNDEATRKALNTLGTSYIETGDFAQAEALLKEALVKPDGTHWNCAYQALGVLYARLEGIEGGPGAEVDAPTPDTTDPRSLYQAAVHHYHHGGRDLAHQYLQQATAIEPRSEFQVLHGFLLLGDKAYAQAEALFREAAARAPEDPGPAVGLGHIAIARQDYGSAARHLEPALDQWLRAQVARSELPSYFDLVHRLAGLGMGWLEANRNQHDRAIRYFDRVLAHRPYDLLARIGKGNSLMGLNLMDQAEHELSEVLQLDPGNPYATAELAAIRLSRGEMDQAEQGFRDALASGGTEYTCPYEGLGLVYLKRGRIDEARTHFERAIELNPDIEYKKYNGLAEIYIQEGRIDEAERLLRKSIANYPYDETARDLLEQIRSRRAAAEPL
ncbi:MAG: hypothetical protein CL928_09960 [Deltaproteobacteria bacterium]|nr:hypothetical protein [Deltaproteobacteria bacterium]